MTRHSKADNYCHIERDGQAANIARERIINTMLSWIRQEALRTLVEKVPNGKQHDSSTGMTFQSLLMGDQVVAGPSGAGAGDDLETSPGDPDDGLD